MKRPNTVPSSSSYRENNNGNVSENLHSKSLGCMSGIFQFACKYQSRKSLTFGKKKTIEKNIVISSSTKSLSPSPTTKAASPKTEQRRFSCEVPDRSPTIPQEIRRSNSVNSPAIFRPSTPSPPHSVVARLMGLTSVPAVLDSNADKKLKLLGALEKCDQDLKALKKIIDAVRSAELAPLRSDPTAKIETKTKAAVSESELPSPVSVLDELTRSPSLSQTRCATRQSNEFRLQQQKKKPGDEEDIYVSPISLFDRIIKTNTTEINIPASVKRRDDADMAWPCTLKMTLSRGMMEGVEQVCKDIAWGQKREMGTIGLALQDQICRDLIEETVKELSSICCSYTKEYAPRFEACKRSLRF